MTTVCFGPPPLPPNKKPIALLSSNTSSPNTGYNNHQHSRQHSATITSPTASMKIKKCAKQLIPPNNATDTNIAAPSTTATNHPNHLMPSSPTITMSSQTYQSFRDQNEDDEIIYIIETNHKTQCRNNNKTFHRKKCNNKHHCHNNNHNISGVATSSLTTNTIVNSSGTRHRKSSITKCDIDTNDGVSSKTLNDYFDDQPKCLKKYRNFENIDQQIDNESTQLTAQQTITSNFMTLTRRCLRHHHSVRYPSSYRKLSVVNSSLNRGLKLNSNGKFSLMRSHSDGNLAKKTTDELDIPISTFSKCVKALSGSLKSLLHLGGMSRPPKPAPTAKKVAPPAVPHEFRHSGSSFGSAGYASSEDGVFITTTDAPGIPRDDHSDYGSTVSGVSSGKSPGPCSGVMGGYGGNAPPSAFPFPGGPLPPGQVLSHKTAVYYHHQLSLQEDQGIDMTQSPGRDSPGSSSGSAGSGSRHSTASLDSGRASAYHPLSSLGVGPARCGPGTSGSGGSPRCSLSSCSIGSEGKIERLIAQGVPDQDIIHAWLQELHYEEYSPLFINAGYDLPTIGRMTPEDLTAIGIKKPNHRKKIKAEIAQLNLPDNLPDYIPGSVEEWLRLLRLEEYAPALHAQGYRTVEDVTQLTWEDLEDIGIVKLGHQKKFMLAIKRVKDIRAGKRFHAPPPGPIDVQGQDHILITSPLIHAPPPSQSQGGGDNDVTDSSAAPPPVHTTFRAFHQPWEVDQTRQMAASCYPALHHTQQVYYQPIYCTDIVPIKIRGGRGKSLESLEDPNERSTHHTFSAENTQTFYYQPAGQWRPRSYDDGDITPTNEVALMYDGGGGTLPRPRGLVRPRPIAKIPAKCRDPAIFHDYEHQQVKCFTGAQYKSLPRDFIEKYHQFGISTSPLKKMPPSPPKRQSSNSTLSSDNTEQTTVEIHAQSSPLPLPAYPSSDSLSISLESGGDLPLPPPPAPSTPPGAAPHRLLPSKSWGGSGEEQELIAALAMQHRNGSDASFKSSSSTESDSLPFANENAGTIKTRAGGSVVQQRPPSRAGGLPPHSSPSPLTFTSHSSSPSPLSLAQSHATGITTSAQSSPLNIARPRSQPADVLNDIGNMLANLTDELDAMLEEEKRQGLSDVQ